MKGTWCDTCTKREFYKSWLRRGNEESCLSRGRFAVLSSVTEQVRCGCFSLAGVLSAAPKCWLWVPVSCYAGREGSGKTWPFVSLPKCCPLCTWKRAINRAIRKEGEKPAGRNCKGRSASSRGLAVCRLEIRERRRTELSLGVRARALEYIKAVCCFTVFYIPSIAAVDRLVVWVNVIPLYSGGMCCLVHIQWEMPAFCSGRTQTLTSVVLYMCTPLLGMAASPGILFMPWGEKRAWQTERTSAVLGADLMWINSGR